jgi:hypothetical protein
VTEKRFADPKVAAIMLMSRTLSNFRGVFVEKRLREQLREINRKWHHAKPLSPKDVALEGLLRDGYLIYSQLSADAAHPTSSRRCGILLQHHLTPDTPAPHLVMEQ